MDTYKLDWLIKTPQEFHAYWFAASNTNPYDFLAKAKEAAISEAYNQLENKANTEGATVHVTNVEASAWFVRTAHTGSDDNPDDWSADYLYHHNIYVTLKIHVVVDFECDQPITGSPIASWVVYILTKIISAIVTIIVAWIITYYVVTAVKEWLEGMTTEHSTITKTTVTTNPETGETTTTTTTEDITKPSLFGTAEIGIVIIVLGVVLIFAVFGIPQKQKRR